MSSDGMVLLLYWFQGRNGFVGREVECFDSTDDDTVNDTDNNYHLISFRNKDHKLFIAFVFGRLPTAAH